MAIPKKRCSILILNAILIVSFIGTSYLLLYTPTPEESNHQSDPILKNDIPNLKTSDYWKLENDYLYINNWTQANESDWCSGKGTFAEPYIVENLTIDAYQKNSCLIIEDTREYFIFNNCTFLNSSETGLHGGVYLENVTNGKFESCKINTNRFGIWMNITHNCSFIKNNVRNNVLDGVYLKGCQNNSFYQNGIRYNNGSGYQLESCQLNVFNDEIVKESKAYGIFLKASDNNTIKFSTFDHCDDWGIYLDENSDINWVVENYVGYSKYEKIDGKCTYILDEGSDNHLINNDWFGECEDDPVYGELEDEEPAIPGYNLIFMLLGAIIPCVLFFNLKRKKIVSR